MTSGTGAQRRARRQRRAQQPPAEEEARQRQEDVDAAGNPAKPHVKHRDERDRDAAQAVEIVPVEARRARPTARLSGAQDGTRIGDRAPAGEGRGSSWSTDNLPKVPCRLTPDGDQRDRRRARLASLQHHRGRSTASGGGGGREGRLADADRRRAPVEVLDAMASWWTAIHGHGHPVLDAAITGQLATMNHVMFGGLTHEPAARLAQLLVEITPDGLDTVFFSDSGSVSVEVAVKMALQYWRSIGRRDKHRLMTWRGGYHGDTFTPMSVCDPDGGMHSLWTDVLAHQEFAPQVPTDYDPAYSEAFEKQLAEHADELAAVIVEPVVQGAGGMRFHDPRYLTDLRVDLRPPRRAADLRRDRHRVRSDRRAVRRRPRRRQPRHHVRRQGDHRRVHHAGRDAVHAARSRTRSAPTSRAR